MKLKCAISLFSSLAVVEVFRWQAKLWKSRGGELARRWAAVSPRMGATRTFGGCCRAC